MGVTYTTWAIIGVKENDLFRKETSVKVITKYNEDTGKPYQKKEITEKCFWLGKEIEGDPWVEGLANGINMTYIDLDGGESLIGKSLVEEGDCFNFNKFSLGHLDLAFGEVREAFQKLGYNGHINLYIGQTAY